MKQAYNTLSEIGGFLFMVALILVIIFYSASVLVSMWNERYETGDDPTDQIEGYWEKNDYFG